MRHRTCAGAAAALLLPAVLFAQPLEPAGRRTPGDLAPKRPLVVPFVPQGPLLCGPAAVEMALRYEGIRGVYARDFQHLVRPEEGGVLTADLASTVRALGWEARAGPSDPAELAQDLEAGRPVVVLLEDAPGRYHYVLVVGWAADAVLFHDPARGPERRLTPQAFLEAWQAAGSWALTLLSRSPPPVADAARNDSDQSLDPAGPDPALLEASRLFRAARWKEASTAAEHAARMLPEDSRAWEVLATSRYLAGDRDGGLEAWNRVGAPRLDLVRVSGLTRTRSTAAHRLAGLRTGELLTVSALLRARRRLALLPAAEETSLSYRVLPGSLAEVEATVVERPQAPRLATAIPGAVIGALVASEVGATMSGPTGGGEAASLAFRWSTARPRVSAALATPGFLGAPGVAVMEARWEKERHHVHGDERAREEERTGVRLALTDWGTAWLRWEVGAGLDRWGNGGRTTVLTAAAEAAPFVDDASLALSAEGGVGAFSYFRWTALGADNVLPRSGPWELRVRALAAGVGGPAPGLLMQGAGTGGVREGLLRAHPLERSGSIEARALGRTLLNLSIEAERSLLVGPWARLGLAAFLDAARLTRAGTAPGDQNAFHGLDGGLGVRLRLTGGTLRMDAAAGSDGSRAFSVFWDTRYRPL